MKLEDIFFARFAEIGPDGLFTVVGGGVNRINVGGFPWTWGIMFLVAQVRLTTEEAQGLHVQSVEREVPDGQIESIVAESPLLQLSPTAETGPDGKVGLTISLCLV